jgi:hypothetical protein
MLSERTIEVCVRDHTDLCSGLVRLGTDETIGQVRPRFVESLAMQFEDDAGNPISYALYNDSHENKCYLQDTQIVGQALSEGQTVRVIPEIIAGGFENES